MSPSPVKVGRAAPERDFAEDGRSDTARKMEIHFYFKQYSIDCSVLFLYNLSIYSF